jgi:DNA-binding NarL/FixJ family response regulator
VTGRGIRLAIVDDDPFVRSGLAMLVRGAHDIEVVAEAADGVEAVAIADAHAPDVVLMDIRMPRVDGLLATERLRSRPRPPHVIVLTTFDADEHVLRALRAGAAGFLLKDAPPRDILHAIRTVAAGDAMLSPAVTRRLIAHVADPAAAVRRTDARSRLAGLTGREREVAEAIGQGLSNAEIATVCPFGRRAGLAQRCGDPRAQRRVRRRRRAIPGAGVCGGHRSQGVGAQRERGTDPRGGRAVPRRVRPRGCRDRSACPDRLSGC